MSEMLARLDSNYFVSEQMPSVDKITDVDLNLPMLVDRLNRMGERMSGW